MIAAHNRESHREDELRRPARGNEADRHEGWNAEMKTEMHRKGVKRGARGEEHLDLTISVLLRGGFEREDDGETGKETPAERLAGDREVQIGELGRMRGDNRMFMEQHLR